MNGTCKLGASGCYEDGKCRLPGADGRCEHYILTVADRIKSSSDEELVEALFWLYRVTTDADVGDVACLWCDGLPGCIDELGSVDCNDEKHKACIMRWLQQPADHFRDLTKMVEGIDAHHHH